MYRIVGWCMAVEYCKIDVLEFVVVAGIVTLVVVVDDMEFEIEVVVGRYVGNDVGVAGILELVVVWAVKVVDSFEKLDYKKLEMIDTML